MEIHRWLSNGSISVTYEDYRKSGYFYDDEVLTTPPNVHFKDGEPDIIQLKRNKYTHSLKTLIPIRPSPKENNYLPSHDAGLFSYISINWLTRFMWKAYRKGLMKEDLWELQPTDRAEPNGLRLKQFWKAEITHKGKDKASFSAAVWRFIRTRIFVAMALITVSMVFQFLGPALLMQALLSYMEDPTQPLQQGLLIAALLFMTQLMRTLTWAAMYTFGCHTAVRLQGAIQYVIYEKMLRLRNGGEKVLSQIISFCTNDQERIYEATCAGVMVLATPVMFTMSLVYTIMLLGPWALIGNFSILLFYPIMGGIARFTSILRLKTVRLTDQRVGMMSEILSSIRLIKMYGWEESFAKNIKSVRREEQGQLQKAAFLQSISATITPSINILASVLTFLSYSLAGNDLTASEAFTIFSVFSAMQFTVGTLPYSIKATAEALICFRRIKSYLDLPEIETSHMESVHESICHAVVINHGTFAWESSHAPVISSKKGDKKGRYKKSGSINGSIHSNGTVTKTKDKLHRKDAKNQSEEVKLNEENQIHEALHDITLEFKRGRLIGICGSVGSGKSSLLSAIMGDMRKITGEMNVSGRMAIVSQQAWIFNESLQENILFGLPLDRKRYEKTIEVCSLKRDLALLANGDMTEIGEKGINLSGGQKQRVNLARAVYSDRDIYLLDDPLSAVDSKVANAIFNQCIKGALYGKTVLLVTHGIHFLRECDEVVLMKEGNVVECTTCGQFDKIEDEFSNFTADDIDTSDSKENDQEKVEEVSDESDDEELGKLIQEEDPNIKSKGSYLKYAKYCGGWCILTLLFVAVLVFCIARLFSSVWLQIWLDMGDGQENERRANESYENMTLTEDKWKGYVNAHPNNWLHQLIYGLTVVVMLILGVFKGVSIARQMLHGSSVLHDRMFRKVLRSPMSFFDTTPAGRILNRFSKDMDEVDVRMPFFVEFVSQSLLFVVSQLILVCVVFPMFSIIMVVILVLFIFFDLWLNVGVRECKKLDNVLRSPAIQHITSTISGLSVIRTYRRQRVFLQRYCQKLNNHLAAETVFHLSSRWFSFRMDFIGVFIIFATAVYAVLSRGDTTAAKGGLAMSAVFSVCIFIPFVMRMKSEMQARFTSVERILEYAEYLVEEAPAHIPSTKPPENWPQYGAIKMEEVKLRYRTGLPLVLHGVDADIKGGEKIGIVGRTGAGKTSLITTLLRMSELDSGSIIIDGVDISKIGLLDLRSAIAVIPQDPVLFQGTIRYNLDPFNDHPDHKIWEALEKSYMKNKISKEDQQLQTVVEADGENFSVGEKQLICLARALIRRNKILLLDEATASVDIETDSLVQNTIKEAFINCTVLTIAHRLNTVIGYDRILVLDAGKMVEFDTPQNLMNQDNSIFRQMMIAMGISSL